MANVCGLGPLISRVNIRATRSQHRLSPSPFAPLTLTSLIAMPSIRHTSGEGAELRLFDEERTSVMARLEKYVGSSDLTDVIISTSFLTGPVFSTLAALPNLRTLAVQGSDFNDSLCAPIQPNSFLRLTTLIIDVCYDLRVVDFLLHHDLMARVETLFLSLPPFDNAGNDVFAHFLKMLPRCAPSLKTLSLNSFSLALSDDHIAALCQLSIRELRLNQGLVINKDQISFFQDRVFGCDVVIMVLWVPSRARRVPVTWFDYDVMQQYKASR